jgi:hypothetical protein
LVHWEYNAWLPAPIWDISAGPSCLQLFLWDSLNVSLCPSASLTPLQSSPVNFLHVDFTLRICFQECSPKTPGNHPAAELILFPCKTIFYLTCLYSQHLLKEWPWSSHYTFPPTPFLGMRHSARLGDPHQLWEAGSSLFKLGSWTEHKTEIQENCGGSPIQAFQVDEETEAQRGRLCSRLYNEQWPPFTPWRRWCLGIS